MSRGKLKGGISELLAVLETRPKNKISAGYSQTFPVLRARRLIITSQHKVHVISNQLLYSMKSIGYAGMCLSGTTQGQHNIF